MNRLLLTLLLLGPTIANAAEPMTSLVSGNALVTSESIQKIVKAIVVNNLSKDFDAQSEFGGISLHMVGANYHLNIPQRPVLQEIMTTLGIQNQLQIQVDPIQTSLNFGPDSLKIKIEKTDVNTFRLLAHWQVDQFVAESKALNILVPKGAFDQAFAISSTPVKIGLNPASGPITADVAIIANLTADGAIIKLENFQTNLADNTPRLQVEFGPLKVNGAPLELQITSNQQSITADEATIRAQFQAFGPELMKNVQAQLHAVIQNKFATLSEKLSHQEPFKRSFQSSEILSSYSMKYAAYANLLEGMSADFIFSYAQEIPTQHLFTTQVSSKICFATTCLSNVFGTSNISTEDSAAVLGNDGGVILYESWVQNLFNSSIIQKRFSEFFKKTLSTPGVTLGSKGLKVHFNPAKNALSAVLNLVIDIKATSPKLSWSWSSVKDYTTNHAADLWESAVGSGQYVYVPVEITAKIGDIKINKDGIRVLMINTEIPFHADGTITNTFKYPCNVQKMNAGIRAQVLESIKDKLTKIIPATIEIPVEKPISIEGIQFAIKKVLVTKNKGLLVSGSIK